MPYTNPIPCLKNDDSILSTSEFESDYLQIQDVYFAFIDVLGFKKTFDEIKITGENIDINKYKTVFSYYFNLMNAANFMKKDNNGCYAGQTSDSLYFYTERTDYLLQFIKIFSHFNLYAMSQNVFFRGGIAKGSLYKKEKYQFYGDSVIKAYLLESVISKNPIITIDESTHKDMQNEPEYNKIVTSDSNRNYIKPFEFINNNIVLDIDNDNLLKEIKKSDIIDNIEKNKMIFEYDANNFSKYVFLSNQLNKLNPKNKEK